MYLLIYIIKQFARTILNFHDNHKFIIYRLLYSVARFKSVDGSSSYNNAELSPRYFSAVANGGT